jgi:polyisoprenoid-binding protein YceI
VVVFVYLSNVLAFCPTLKNLIWVALFWLAALPLQAQQWKPLTGSVTFKIKMWGATVDGSFKGLAANVTFDPAQLGSASIYATVEAATVDTDNNLRNRHLREKEEFFDSKKYPQLRLKSTKIEKVGNGYLGTFDLTIKQTTRSVQLPFTFVPSGSQAQLKGSVTINRRDWKVGGGTLGMADEVTISLTLNVQASPTANK